MNTLPTTMQNAVIYRIYKGESLQGLNPAYVLAAMCELAGNKVDPIAVSAAAAWCDESYVIRVYNIPYAERRGT